MKTEPTTNPTTAAQPTEKRQPRTGKPTAQQTTAIAKRSDYSDPFLKFGPAADQIPIKLPVAKIEYLANDQIRREHPEFKEGFFSLNVGEQLPTLTVALIGIRYGRTLWPADYDPKNPDRDTLCKSDDGIYPSGGLEFPKSTVTANGRAVCVHLLPDGSPARSNQGKYIPACPFAMWGSNREAPACREVFTLLMYEHTLNLPLVFSVKGTGIKHISKLRLDMLRFQRELPDDLPLPATAYTKIIVSVDKVQRWYEPRFSIAGRFSDVEVEINAEALASVAPTFSRMATDDFRYNGAAESEDEAQ